MPGSGGGSGHLYLADLSDRAKLRFTGPQALWFLDQLVTNQILELPPGAGKEALLLTPNGRITSHLRILHAASEAEAEVLIDGPPGHAERLKDFFEMRVFATKVKIGDVSGESALLRLVGSEAASLASEVLEIDPPDTGEHSNVPFSVHGEPGLAVRIEMPMPGLDLWIPRRSTEGVARSLIAAGVAKISAGSYEQMRVTAGLPQFSVDFDETYLPQEAAMERAVHFSKGCYLGQEAVAMAQRGKVKRRLRHLEFEDAGITGTLLHGQDEAGRVTSAAAAGGRWFGIGTVKTSVSPGDSVYVLDESGKTQAAAVVRELPGTTYGPRVPSARELRERLRS